MHPTNALVAGVLTLAAAFFLGGKQILGGPHAVNYPSQRPATQAVSFVLACILLLRGADLLMGCLHGAPESLHFSAVLGGLALSSFFGVRFWDTLHMRAPARFWRRVDRAMRALNCPPVFFDPLARARRDAMLAVNPPARPRHVADVGAARAATAELILAGANVDAVPNETPGRLH